MNVSMQMRSGTSRMISTIKTTFSSFSVVIICLMLLMKGVLGIRFNIIKTECLSHNVDYVGDTVYMSFVVIKADAPWRYGHEGVDLVINNPWDELVQEFRDRTSDKYEFIANKSGLYRFCFTNKAPTQETIHFDVHTAHFMNHNQIARDEHFYPMLQQITKLEEALYNIQFEQHWLEAQTDRQALVNEAMGRRAMHKAIFESLLLIGASVLQVYLLRQLFERKLGSSIV